jgi:hypothetical protein
MRFPTIVARDLEGRSYAVPDDLPGTWRVLVVPFKRWQQILVNAWEDVLAPVVEKRPEVTLWEIPSLSRAWGPVRGYIDGGMRAGIPDADVRRHTLTTYTDLGRLAKTLSIEDFETVQVFLLDAAGEIVWRCSGAPDVAKAESFADAVLGDPAS